MKRIMTLLVSISILFGVLAFAAAEGETTAALNAGEEWAAVYSGIVGEGQVMQMEPLNPSDGINSRFIFINDQWPELELRVAVRTSETEVVCWRLPLSKNNVSLALGTLYNHVPMCYVESRKDGEMPETAMYIRSTANSTTFAKFLVDAKQIVRSARYGKIAAEEPSADPVLSLFPGIRWGMTNEEMVADYGLEAIPDDLKVSTRTILGKEVDVCFSYKDGILNVIGLVGSENIASIRDQLIETYNTLYGEAKRVNYMKAISRDYTENVKDDCNCWIFKRTVILIPDEKNLVSYQPIY